MKNITKRTLSIILCVTMVLSIYMLVPFTVNAETPDVATTSDGETRVVEKGIIYSLNSDGRSYYVDGRVVGENAPTLTIAKTIEGYPVTRIDSDAFFTNTFVEKVFIPNTIESIGYSVFANCRNLEEVTFESGSKLKNIGCMAFSNCPSLVRITIPKSVQKIESRAFELCKALYSVDIEYGSKLKTIESRAFENCTRLAEVMTRDGLETIGDYAFFNCPKLKSFFIPDSVTLIDIYALACFEHENSYYLVSDFVISGGPNSLALDFAQAYGVQYALAAPQLISVENTSSGVKVSFKHISGVQGGKYRVYRRSDGNSWKALADITSTSYTDTTVVPGGWYFYTVKYIASDGTTSLYHKTGLSTIRLTTPSVTKIDNINEGVKISWSKVEGAWLYRVYYKTASGWTSIGDVGGTNAVHKDAVPNTTYTYTVKAFGDYGSTSSFNSTGWTNKYITTPFVKNAEVTNSGVKLTWDKVAGAENYRVFIKNGSSWKGLATVSGTTNNYVDKTATAGNSYTYTIRCMDSSGNFVSDYDKEGFTVRYLETPQITGFENTADGTVITWNEVEGAEKYRLYVKKDDSWKMLFDVEGTSFIHSDLEDGVEYTYTIRCITEDSKTLESGFDSTGFTNLYEKPEITVLTGDADLDGELSVLDASLIQMYLVGKKTLEGEALIAADADLDGEISVLDASLIQMILVGKK